jgi:murein DD-endopeptidase MepM/ murein hydrolase activator NlpD
MRILVLLATLASLLLNSAPVQAGSAAPPGQKTGQYVRWYYPSQLPYGTLEDGTSSTGSAASPKAFLTLPFMGPHIVTSGFDHCAPDYSTDGQYCRYDGVEVSAGVGGPDPTFTAGYAQTPGGHDYLYYDGHDGYDYALTYEPVAAAADGVVSLADWLDPNCHSCLFGLAIYITHGNGMLSAYGHLSQIFVSKGQRVRRGQVIGISGSTGSATGPHLHFGIYSTTRQYTAIDPYGWSGSTPDPYDWDQGDLWLGGSPRFANIPMPKVSVSAVPDVNDPAAIDVSWSSPGDGNVFVPDVVQQDGSMKPLSGPTGAGSAVFHGQPGQTYWFWVSVTTNLGWKDSSGSLPIRLPLTGEGPSL